MVKEHTVTMPVSLWDRKAAEIAKLKAELVLVKECEKNSVEIADDAMAELAELKSKSNIVDADIRLSIQKAISTLVEERLKQLRKDN